MSFALNSKNLDRFVDSCYDNGIINGNLLIAKNGNTLYSRSLGYADFRNLRKNNTNTAFYLASVSKQFTATAVLQLVQSGQLSLQDKLNDHLTGFNQATHDVQIHHLLAHTSGIKDYFDEGKSHPGITNQQVLNFARQQQLNFAPGSQFSYSNTGYVLLSLIIEKVSQLSFQQFLNDNIFTPLNMQRSLVFTSRHLDNRAVGFDAKQELANYDILTTGGGGIYSTLGDLLKWDQGLYTNKVLSSQYRQLAFTPALLSNNETSDYGYGWRVRTDRGEATVAHSGRLSGFSTYIERQLASKITIILLMNHGEFDKKMQFIDAVNALIQQQPVLLPCNSTNLAHHVSTPR